MPDEPRPARLARSTRPHLAAGELAAYLDGVLHPAGRRRIEAHLVRCDDCLGEVIAALTHVQGRDRSTKPD